ncbi:hypothetical protein [Pseudonocardia sp. NPDC049635]|uniref:hypothetical protein n=1 Tax=Pseudonocardia sp. NPDC049635 TaxID=3155506 RepID=UPI0033E52E1C
MSETPSRGPRHALADTGSSVPAQGGPREAAADVPGDETDTAAAQARPEPTEQPLALDVPRQAEAGPRSRPDPQPSGDPVVQDRLDDGPTQALPVIPRPRDHAVQRAGRAPEPRRSEAGPEASRGAASRRGGVLGLIELPSSVRPVLPAVLGAATALLLALGVVAGVNGASEPPPVPPAPATAP